MFCYDIEYEIESIEKDRKDWDRVLDKKTVIEVLVFANSLDFDYDQEQHQKATTLELKNFILTEEPVSLLDVKKKSQPEPEERKETPQGLFHSTSVPVLFQ